MIVRVALVAAMVLALAGCGNRRELSPAKTAQLPVAPYGKAYRPTADDLLTRPAQTAPSRNIELNTRSEERPDDPFDLPPS